MKKINFLLMIAGLLFPAIAIAQADSSVLLDVLRAPATPAFVLLGVSPTDIQKPTDPTQLYINLNNASNGFSALPKNYSLQLAPFWIFDGKCQTLDDFISGKKAIPQTLTLSIGTHTADSINATTETSVGISFSIIRHAVDEATGNAIKLYRQQLDSFDVKISGIMLRNRKNDAEYRLDSANVRNAQRQLLSDQGAGKSSDLIHQDSVQLLASYKKQNDRDSAMLADLRTENLDSLMSGIQDNANGIQFNREGFNLDFSAGTVIDFPDQNINKGTFSRAGAWLTGSYTGNRNFDLVFVARWLYGMNLPVALNDSIVQENANNLDVGAKVNYNNDKLSVSLEYLDRHYFENDFTSTYRLVFNASYSFAPNKAITFSFGRDFDGTITKNGNLVTALNLVLGFGGKKSL